MSGGFAGFGHDDAWSVGSSLVERARAEGLAVTIAIWLGDQRVFHAALAGTTADNDDWVERKARVVRRFDAPSQEISERFAHLDFHARFRLPPADFAASGGAVPIRIQGGGMIGVVAVSGLAGPEDHELVVDALERHAAIRAARTKE